MKFFSAPTEKNNKIKPMKGWFGKWPTKGTLKSERRNRAIFNTGHYVDLAVKRIFELRERKAGSNTIELAINEEAAKYACDYIGLTPNGKGLQKREKLVEIVRQRTMLELEPPGFVERQKKKFQLWKEMMNVIWMGWEREVFNMEMSKMYKKIRKVYDKQISRSEKIA